jgi:DNA-binding CsgD family transcriptional regulator
MTSSAFGNPPGGLHCVGPAMAAPLTPLPFGVIRQMVVTWSPGDVRGLQDAVNALTAGSDADGFPGRVFAAIDALIDPDFISYNDVNLATGEVRFVLRPRPVPAERWHPTAFLRRFGYHPAATSVVGIPDDAVPRFVRDPQLRALGVGNCCGEAEIRLNAGLALAGGRSRLVGIGVSFATRSFSDRERRLMAAFEPKLAVAFAATLPKPMQPNASSPPVRLTRRENEVMYWVAMGKTNEEIATIIGARPMTVKKHLEHVYEKLAVPNRTAAVIAAHKLGVGTAELILPPAGA